MNKTSSHAKPALLLIALGLSCYLGALLIWTLKPEPYTTISTTSLLETIQQRGYIKCGVASNRMGFSVQDTNSAVDPMKLQPADQELPLYEISTGLEADMCRAIAIGLFGSTEENLYFHSVDGSWAERMTKVTDGTIDVLFRGTGMHKEIGVTHDVDTSQIIYYEPNVLMTSVDHADAKSEQLQKANICTLKSTFSEKSAMAYSKQHKLGWLAPDQFSPEARSYSSYQATLKSLQENECSGIVGRLSSLRTMLFNKKLQNTYHLLPLRTNDSVPVVGVLPSEQTEWKALVNQSIWTLIKAQAQGTNANNVTVHFNGMFWTATGLDSTNPSRIIKSLGNYAEIYQRHFGELSISSGPNNHYTVHPEGRLVAPY